MSNDPPIGDQHASRDDGDESLESLIQAMLALSPEERLRQNDRMLRTIEILRKGEAEKAGQGNGQEEWQEEKDDGR
jgi:hypothetical protein